MKTSEIVSRTAISVKLIEFFIFKKSNICVKLVYGNEQTKCLSEFRYQQNRSFWWTGED